MLLSHLGRRHVPTDLAQNEAVDRDGQRDFRVELIPKRISIHRSQECTAEFELSSRSGQLVNHLGLGDESDCPHCFAVLGPHLEDASTRPRSA